MTQKNIYKSNYSYMVAFFCLLFLGSVNSQGQDKPSVFIDSTFNKIERYGISKQAPEMFVHFDKTIYSTNENVWFTAYLLDTTKQAQQNTLIVGLIKDNERGLLIQEKFVINNGIAFGNLFLSDSLTTGNYTFVVYTNLIANSKPLVVFKQPITIKSVTQPTFTALLSPIDTAASSAQKTVRLVASKSAIEGLPDAEVNYYVGSPADHLLSGKVKTDPIGQYVFTIPSKILSEGNNKLYVTIKYKSEVKEISMNLPVATKRLPMINFYPEGGNLVNNLSAYVGWETKTADNVPMQVSAILYKDDKVIDTIETNGYGMGKFLLRPQYGNNYSVKLYGDDLTTYKLPRVLTAGITLSVQQALANDTLLVTLHSTGPQNIFVFVHNYKQLHSAVRVNMASNSKGVKVLLADVPKGINQLTITDSLGRPFAQRTFFAHYDQKQTLQINTNIEYKPREKVNVKVRLNGSDTTAMALVSIAAVQENRIEIKKRTDIESYFYLNSQLGDLPVKESYLGNNDADKQFLENVLLTKGWSKYKWTDVLNNDNKPVDKFDAAIFSGLVTNFNYKPLKKPVEVVLMKPEGIKPLQTDSSGRFIVDYQDMITMQNKKINLIVSGDNAKWKYKLKLTDPYIKVSQKIPAQLSYKDYSTAAQQSTANMQLPGFQSGIQLKEVTINGRNDGFFHGNECGDYVCIFNILNCPNHRIDTHNKPPVKGEVYTYNGLLLKYDGCRVGSSDDIKGIYNAMEFYPSDYEKDSTAQPEYISTIYWKHLEKVTAGKETNFSFYTSDITGKFKIIIQGITENDVVYGEKTFNVRSQ